MSHTPISRRPHGWAKTAETIKNQEKEMDRKRKDAEWRAKLELLKENK